MRERLSGLGFSIEGTGGAEEAVIDLLTPLINPLTRRFIERVAFRIVDDTLVPSAPPDIVGLPPLSIAGLERLSDFDAHLRGVFETSIFQLQRRSSELQSLGIQPRIDPERLELRAELTGSSLRLTLGADKAGNFRVISARRGEQVLHLPPQTRFELSEFRDRGALLGFLEALVEDAPPPIADGTDALATTDWGAAFELELPVEAEVTVKEPPPAAPPVTLGELARRFGERAALPQRASLEIVADLLVRDVRYRFAASRVAEREFRGLLAGPVGKIWADRFELDDFGGIESLVAQHLDVAPTEVEVLGLAVELGGVQPPA